MTRQEIQDHQTAGTITERQAEILELRRRGHSQYEIARGLHITRSTVRSIERTAIDKIAAAELRKEAA